MQHVHDWDEFHQLPLGEKLPLFQHNGDLFDVIYAQQFSREALENLFSLTDKIRNMGKTKEGADVLGTLLSDKRAMLFFVQPSTRTFLSFQNACHVLGMKTSEIRDASTSSEVKGESPADTIRTFSSYVDIIVIRHHEEGFAEKSAWVLNALSDRPVPVINGGSGKDQHPTQALLDMYTLQRAFKDHGGIDNKTVAMVGDLKRGRTVRSLCHLLSLYNNIELYFVSPPEFAMQQDILDFCKAKNITFHVTDDFESVMPKSDAIYLTRLQDEHDSQRESQAVDYTKFHFRQEHLSRLKPHAAIMHPFPRRQEIEVSVDKDPRALYWKQARNGMWIRAALILQILRPDITL